VLAKSCVDNYLYLTVLKYPGQHYSVEENEDYNEKNEAKFQLCFKNFRFLKRKYDELLESHQKLQKKVNYSEDSSDDQSNGSESCKSEDSDDCDGESVPENGQTVMQSAKKISGPLSRISTPLNKMLSVLRGLMKLTRSEQRKFISTCHSDFLRYFAFCAREIVSENYKVTADQLKKLRRQKRLVKSLAQSRISLKTIRVILQTCGFLQLLLPSAIGMLSSVLNKQ